MKKFKKYILIITVNVVFIAILLQAIDYLIYGYYAKTYSEMKKNNILPVNYVINPYAHKAYLPNYMLDLFTYFTGKTERYEGRVQPDGKEYFGKNPIVLFGCSYAFGENLEFNQTFSYKLAHILKRPVYNRGIRGGTFTNMYLQVTQQEGKPFFNEISSCDTVIYIMINDHYRRSMINYFMMLDLHVIPHLNVKHNELISDDYNNKFLNFIKSTYIYKYINHEYAQYYVNNPKNAEKISDTTLLYFTKTREILEKRWGKKVNFTIIYYDIWPIPHGELLKKKFEDNGFNVIKTSELTSENLENEKYLSKVNSHPTEEAWNLLTPLIIEKLNLN